MYILWQFLIIKIPMCVPVSIGAFVFLYLCSIHFILSVTYIQIYI